MAVGNPLGELGGTVTGGMISALNRSVTIQGSSSEHHVPDPDGCFGQPRQLRRRLFNMNGELVGIVNAKSSSDAEGLGFAIPINDAIKVAQELLENGYVTGRPYLGITLIGRDRRTDCFSTGRECLRRLRCGGGQGRPCRKGRPAGR